MPATAPRQNAAPPEFRVPTCQCGHASGDHVTVRVPLTARAPGGTCKRCPCAAFDEVTG